MKKFYEKLKSKSTIKRLVVCVVFTIRLMASPCYATLPTFDYSNLVQAIESTYRQVEFFNETTNKLKDYERKFENAYRKITSDDFFKVMSGVEDALSILNTISKNIDKIVKDAEKRRTEAEILNKEATLEILNILTDPSIDSIKKYVDGHKKDKNLTDLAKSVASDTKKAMELLLNDHSKTADAAIEKLENDKITLARELTNSYEELKNIRTDYSDSMTATETISSMLAEISEVKTAVENAEENINDIKKLTSETKDELQEYVDSWSRIEKAFDDASKNNKKLDKTAKTLKQEIKDKVYFYND